MSPGPATLDDVMLRTAVMSSSMAMAVTDPYRPDNPIVFTNPAFSILTGYDGGSIVGRNCRFLQGRDTDPAAVAAIGKALANCTDLQVDILNYRRDGSPFTNRLFISPVCDADGRLIHFFASQLDATELIRADAVKRRREDVLRYLAGELTQRLNATLRVVETLVSNTLASAASVPEASEAISARLVALGQVHRQIAANDWEDEDFEELVHQTIAPFCPEVADCDIAGPRLRLGALLSLKMASAIHELSLNAAVRRIGEARRVQVEWSTQDAPGGRRLLFTWREQGASHQSPAERNALHRAMTKIMNDSDAAVSVRLDHEREGLACRIDAALAATAVGSFTR